MFNSVGPTNRSSNQPVPPKKPGFFNKVGKLATGLFTKKPKAVSENLHHMEALEPDEKVASAIKNVLPTKAQKVLEAVGIHDEADIEFLTPDRAKQIAKKEEVKAYLREGDHLPTLSLLAKIISKAEKNHWELEDQTEEVEAFKHQITGKTELYKADISRAVSFKINGEEVGRDDRIGALKDFALDDSYATRLSHAVQQGLASKMSEKITMSFLEDGVATGRTAEVSGGVQDIEIERDGDQLVLTLSVLFPLSSVHCTVEQKSSHILDLLGTVTVEIDEEDFKKGDYSKAHFTHTVDVYDAPPPSPSASVDDFHLV